MTNMYKHLSKLVHQLITVVDQTAVSELVCSTTEERECRQARLSQELNTILCDLRETQLEIEQHMSPIAPARSVQTQSVDDDWEQLVDVVKDHLENSPRIPGGWFGFRPKTTESKRFQGLVHKSNVDGFVRHLDNLWEDLDDMDSQYALIQRVVRLINAEYGWTHRSDYHFGRRESGSFGWIPADKSTDSSTDRGSDA